MSNLDLQKSHPLSPATELRVGDVVEGIVTELTNDEIFLDVSCKTDACMSRSELKESEEIKRDDKICVKVTNINSDQGLILVSRNRVVEEAGFKKLLSSYKNGEEVTGTVSAIQSHGFTVTLCDGLEAFMPFSQSGISKTTDSESCLQKEISVLITKIEQLRKSYDIVVSRRELVTQKLQAARSVFLEKYKEGDIVNGFVESVLPTYARIRVDGVPMTITQNEISWLNNVSLRSEFTVGQSVQVKIITLAKEGRQIFASTKALSEDPWLTIHDRLKIDSCVEGTIETIKDFGIFVRVDELYQGLVHISEISWANEKKAIKSYKEGQRVKVKILAIEVDTRRLTLSIRQIASSPWEQYYQEHTNEVVSVEIIHTHKFGLVCKMNDDGIEGFLHQSQISWGNMLYNPEEYTIGDKIEVAVIGASNRHRKVRLSLKMHQENPWDTLAQLKQEHAVVEVTVSKKTQNGLVVSVGDGVEGFIHVNHIANFEHLPPEELLSGFQQGDVIEADISIVDKQKKQVYLSTKHVEAARQNEEMERYMVSDDEQTANIADLTDRS